MVKNDIVVYVTDTAICWQVFQIQQPIPVTQNDAWIEISFTEIDLIY